MIAKVILPLPLDRAFDFLVPDELEAKIAVGKRVKVRFQGVERFGIITAIEKESAIEGPLEPILAVSTGPSFSREALDFCSRIASDNLSPPGIFLNRLLPKRVSGVQERFFAPIGAVGDIVSHLEGLSRRAPRQAAVLRALLVTEGSCSEKTLRNDLGSIRGTLDCLVEKGLIVETPPPGIASQTLGDPLLWVKGLLQIPLRAGQALLFSDSRWEGYTHLAKAILEAGKSVLVLTPEILLARQLHSYLQGRLGETVDLYHSNLPEGERGRVWERTHRGEACLSQVHLSQARLIVGTRSALFLPLDDLGLLIVDEEQDRSYKQDEMIPHYHARTAAAVCGEGAFLLFGSAAPSLETFHATESGAITLIRPPISPVEREVRIVPMNREKEPLSAELLAAIARTLEQGKRVLLAVNRRGSFQAILCKKCGQPLRCPHCGGTLTYGVRSAQLVCRICGTAQPRMVCSHCGSRALRFVGVGSARVEDEVKERFPSARVVRIDTDTLRTREQERVAERALNGEGEILVATPMIAKGPPLPRLGLVGAIGVDALLALPDFRAAERTYQYLTGLLGRLSPVTPAPGQGSLVGEAIVQTHYPDHIAILSAMDGDYDRFYVAEIAERKELFYPPFSHLARLILSTRGRGRQKDGAERLLSLLHQFEVEILGPAPHPTRSECQVLLLKGLARETVREACAAAQQDFPRIEIDIDPERI